MNTEPKKSEQPSMRRALKTVPLRLLRVCTHNWPWKLLSLFLAISLWAGLITQDPSLTREHVFNDVPVTVIGVDTLRRNGKIVLSGLEGDALISRLRADVPQREYNNVTASIYNPRVDLSRITETGEQTLRILTTTTTIYGSAKVISNETLDVIVDDYITNYRVPVSVNKLGEYPAGFYGTIPSLDPSVVAVSGPKSIIKKLSRIYIDFDVSRLSAQAGLVRTAIPMRFVDSDNQTIQSDLLEVTSADVLLRTIIVEQQLYPTKTLSVTSLALSEGVPAAGYELKSITASPTTFLAAGEEVKLSALESIFTDNPVDISDRSESFTVDVKLHKPSELIYLSADTVTLYFEITPTLITRIFDKIKLTTRGQAAGLVASVEQKTVSISITGPQMDIDALKADALNVYVDASRLGAGEHELPINLQIENENATNMSFAINPSTTMVLLAKE